MTCKRNGCDNPVTGKALYCSGACRTKASRVSVTDVTVPASVTHQRTVTRVTESVTPEQEGALRLKCASEADPIPPIDRNVLEDKPTLAHYHARPDLYANRTKPEMLNWGPWMIADELARAKLSANRVPIPGDWDYAGVGVKP